MAFRKKKPPHHYYCIDKNHLIKNFSQMLFISVNIW